MQLQWEDESKSQGTEDKIQRQKYFFFTLQACATSDRSRQLRRLLEDKAIQYSVHKEAERDSCVSLRKSQLASQVQK